jgi:DNA-binding ferritin-like protein
MSENNRSQENDNDVQSQLNAVNDGFKNVRKQVRNSAETTDEAIETVSQHKGDPHDF